MSECSHTWPSLNFWQNRWTLSHRILPPMTPAHKPTTAARTIYAADVIYMVHISRHCTPSSMIDAIRSGITISMANFQDHENGRHKGMLSYIP